jgi:hypothetical protein
MSKANDEATEAQRSSAQPIQKKGRINNKCYELANAENWVASCFASLAVRNDEKSDYKHVIARNEQSE